MKSPRLVYRGEEDSPASERERKMASKLAAFLALSLLTPFLRSFSPLGRVERSLRRAPLPCIFSECPLRSDHVPFCRFLCCVANWGAVGTNACGRRQGSHVLGAAATEQDVPGMFSSKIETYSKSVSSATSSRATLAASHLREMPTRMRRRLRPS